MIDDGWTPAICKHCGHDMIWAGAGTMGSHTTGRGNHLGRCQETENEYGYNAEPIGEPCAGPCLGTSKPDLNELTKESR